MSNTGPLKYGLNLPKKRKAVTAPLNVFENAVAANASANVASRVSANGDQQRRKAEEEKARLLAEDPNVYEFDSVYDDMAAAKKERLNSKLTSASSRQPRYMEALQKRALERKREQEVVYQNIIRKERVAEDHLYQSTEAFVTAGYKEQMMKDNAWQVEQDRIDEQHAGPTSRGMAGFLSNVLAPSVPSSISAVVDDHTPKKPPNREDKHHGKSAPTRAQEPPAEKPLSRRDRELAASPSSQRKQAPPHAAVAREQAREAEIGAVSPSQEQAQQSAAVVPEQSRATEPAPVPAPQEQTRRTTLDSAAAARERYLQRKREREAIKEQGAGSG
ncbi:Nuclear speckle splicing regulatory protein 1 N-terminal domain-containing protein [Plasmodiophora brassicae]|nr:hypothetical protein PBRA_000638 [Plasmodiophora brassicae]